MLLLDEITVDMDVVGRLDLLQFFKEECGERGATIIYVRRGLPAFTRSVCLSSPCTRPKHACRHNLGATACILWAAACPGCVGHATVFSILPCVGLPPKVDQLM